MADLTGALYAGQRAQQARLDAQEKQITELLGLMRQTATAPRWIEDIPGKRSSFFAVIEIVIAANSTTRVEGTYTVSTDGPFACTGIAMFFQRTGSPYPGGWRPATTVDARMAPNLAQLGVQMIWDSPVLGSFDVEFSESGSDRNWQNMDFASAIFSPSVGCVYMLPITQMFGRASVVTCRVTPTFAQDCAGKVQCILLGYKIVQADNYQP
jgi:hypothetical protein